LADSIGCFIKLPRPEAQGERRTGAVMSHYWSCRERPYGLLNLQEIKAPLMIRLSWASSVKTFYTAFLLAKSTIR